MVHAYGFGVELEVPFDAAVAAVTAALKQEGFGVSTTIDVQATLKAKLDVDYRPYVILGAGNPHLAYQGLKVEPELGLLLPCNVVVYDHGDGAVRVSIFDPFTMLGMIAHPALNPIAAHAYLRLKRVPVHIQTDLSRPSCIYYGISRLGRQPG